jgi:hypothetical protein
MGFSVSGWRINENLASKLIFSDRHSNTPPVWMMMICSSTAMLT